MIVNVLYCMYGVWNCDGWLICLCTLLGEEMTTQHPLSLCTTINHKQTSTHIKSLGSIALIKISVTTKVLLLSELDSICRHRGAHRLYQWAIYYLNYVTLCEKCVFLI